MSTPIPDIGARVRIERDETRFPSRGSWPRFRGKTGTVVEINHDRRRRHLTEYGVVFGRVRPARPNGSVAMSDVTWFKRHEFVPIRALASESHAERTAVTV
ncbi:hypothetical protein [Mycolicibacterium smegmatis]|uniref:Uncharacterized protein n=1 Tax=Mycolicibacterium smegmatis (strain MKD8) TaxID=1214915 RepID=A0A2U9PLH9_MYCSE|nr:hypothetical protein [Mycolicibacterium smegmatis]AWT52587.1 hypothetical protein D806_016030 [Mycolicibacterium smegmatis MKD8]